MKVCIRGVAGWLGSRLADWINNNTKHSVIGIDDLSGGYMDNVNKEVEFYKFDLSMGENVDRLFRRTKPDLVYHFAAYAAEGLSPFMRSYNYRNNLISTAKVVNACINYNVKRIIFTSSMFSVYSLMTSE